LPEQVAGSEGALRGQAAEERWHQCPGKGLELTLPAIRLNLGP